MRTCITLLMILLGSAAALAAAPVRVIDDFETGLLIPIGK